MEPIDLLICHGTAYALQRRFNLDMCTAVCTLGAQFLAPSPPPSLPLCAASCTGKTYTAKLIKDQEVANKGSAPRILSLDDYFCTEKEKTVTDPDTGKSVTKKVTAVFLDRD